MQQLLGTLLLLPAEQLLNSIMQGDPHLLRSFSPFVGKTLEINSTTPRVSLLIRFQEQRIRLSAMTAVTLQQRADATVAGTASELQALLFNTEDRPLANRAITISGDALFVQDLFTALQESDIDWRDFLTPFLGDVATHEISKLGDQTRRWGSQARHNLRRSFHDYVKEEIRLVPDAGESERFAEQLDQLKLAIDRVSARTEQLRERLGIL